MDHNTKVDWSTCDNPLCNNDFCKEYMSYVTFCTGYCQDKDGTVKNKTYEFCSFTCLSFISEKLNEIKLNSCEDAEAEQIEFLSDMIDVQVDLMSEDCENKLDGVPNNDP